MTIKEGKGDEYLSWRKKNNDRYGRTVFTYAERWAGMMEKKIGNHPEKAAEVIAEHAYNLSHEADVEGITGFMFGCAVQILALCWEYGEELRVWHNKRYGHEGDGVVNPAIMTVSAR